MLLTMNSQPAEPAYAGKTVDEWLDAGYEDASMALHEIGTPAMPYQGPAAWGRKSFWLLKQN